MKSPLKNTEPLKKKRKIYRIYQDGKLKGKAKSLNEALMKVHKLQPFSWDYAMKYGGWKIK